MALLLTKKGDVIVVSNVQEYVQDLYGSTGVLEHMLKELNMVVLWKTSYLGEPNEIQMEYIDSRIFLPGQKVGYYIKPNVLTHAVVRAAVKDGYYILLNGDLKKVRPEELIKIV